MTKKVYTVRGSEDGILGVYTTRGAAIDKAIEYTSVEGEREIAGTRTELIRILKNGYVSVVPKDFREGYGSASIELFYLNQ